MVGLLERLFGRSSNESKSGKLAKDRLQLVLVQDRIDIPSEKMKEMQEEIIQVISKYVTVDMDNVDFALRNRERDGVLVAEIPFRPPLDKSSKSDPDNEVSSVAPDASEEAVKISVEEPKVDDTSALESHPTAQADVESDEAQLPSNTDKNKTGGEGTPEADNESTESTPDADDD